MLWRATRVIAGVVPAAVDGLGLVLPVLPGIPLLIVGIALLRPRQPVVRLWPSAPDAGAPPRAAEPGAWAAALAALETAPTATPLIDSPPPQGRGSDAGWTTRSAVSGQRAAVG